MLTGMASARQMQQLQSVQNTVARRRDHVTPVLLSRDVKRL